MAALQAALSQGQARGEGRGEGGQEANDVSTKVVLTLAAAAVDLPQPPYRLLKVGEMGRAGGGAVDMRGTVGHGVTETGSMRRRWES